MREINIVFDGKELVTWGFSDKIAQKMSEVGLDIMRVEEDIIWDVKGVRNESNQKGW
jgi:hypothetical protein